MLLSWPSHHSAWEGLISPHPHPCLVWHQPYVFVLHFNYLFCVICTTQDTCRGQKTTGITLLLPACGPWGCNWGCQAWRHSPLPTELSLTPVKSLHNFGYLGVIWWNLLYGFNFHFPRESWYWTSFHMLNCQPCGFFVKNNVPTEMELFTLSLSPDNVFSHISRFQDLYWIWHANVFSLIFFLSHPYLLKRTSF